MLRLAPWGAALGATLAAWLSQGTIGLAGADGHRLAVLPVSTVTFGIAALAGAVTFALIRGGASVLPVCLLALLGLPWLPFPVPAAFLLWVWPVSAAVWIAVGLLMLRSLPRARTAFPGSPQWLAGGLAFLLFALCAWRVAPMIPGGDEPHYLVITQSLLLDGDLSIEDVHRRGDYRAYFSGDLAPHVQRRGRDGQIYSVHAPGLPALVAPAFAVGGYRAVVVCLLLIASAGSALAWHVAWLATRRSDAAWFAWAAVTLPVTAIFQSFTVYPDGPGGVLALTGLWALLRAEGESDSGSERTLPWLGHGAALALLPWLHSRFAVLAGGLGALILLRLARTRNPAGKAVAFLSIPAVSAILWVGFFIAIYGTPDPSAPYASGELGSMAFVPGGLIGLLFDQRFGLLAYAPVLGVAMAGVALMIGRPRWRRAGLELLFVIVPYLLTVTHFAMWWGGWSPPARFFAPVLPLMVLPAAIAWTVASGRTTRLFASGLLAMTAIASAIVVAVDRGRMAFNTREAPALWLEWLGRLADLSAAAPMWARETDVPLFRTTAIWLIAAACAWLLLRRAERSPRARAAAAFQTLTAFAMALVMMAGTTIVWAVEQSNPHAVAGSQLRLLDAVASENRVLGLELNGMRSLAAAELPARLRIEQVRRPGRRPAGREAQAMFTLPPLPAGRYRITVDAPEARGWLMVGISREPRDPFALRTVQLPFAPLDLAFPLPVRALVVRGDDDAWRTVRGITVEPLAVFGPDARVTPDLARRAVRYDTSTVYFVDEGSYPEPEAFWVAGARESSVVVQPDEPRPVVTIRLRNAPVENRVVIQTNGWTREWRMQPGEEQQVDVPIDGARGGTLLRITTSDGFRPADRDSTSRDQRFLGVWVSLK